MPFGLGKELASLVDILDVRGLCIFCVETGNIKHCKH